MSGNSHAREVLIGFIRVIHDVEVAHVCLAALAHKMRRRGDEQTQPYTLTQNSLKTLPCLCKNRAQVGSTEPERLYVQFANMRLGNTREEVKTVAVLTASE